MLEPVPPLPMPQHNQKRPRAAMPMPTKPRAHPGPPATAADIAARLGVSTSTVTKALAGNPKVSARTRAAVLAEANASGFQPSPTASLLAKRRHTREASPSLRIALLQPANNETDYLRGKASKAGVDLEELPRDLFSNPRRALDVLWNRGVNGLLINPDYLPWSPEMCRDLPWHRFSVVKLSRARNDLPFHLVRHDAFDHALTALRHACAPPTKRLCVVLWTSASAYDDLARHGAVTAFRDTELHGKVDLQLRYWSGHLKVPDPEVLKWLRRLKPDSVLLFHSALLRTLEMGTFPKDFSPRFYGILNHESDRKLDHPIAGCNATFADRADHALNLLLTLIGRGERGLPSAPSEQVIAPVWIPARST